MRLHNYRSQERIQRHSNISEAFREDGELAVVVLCISKRVVPSFLSSYLSALISASEQVIHRAQISEKYSNETLAVR